jgi:hypothetical protein
MGRFLMAGRGGLALAVFGTAPYEGRYSVAGGGAFALAVVATGSHEGAFEGGGVASPFPSLFLAFRGGTIFAAGRAL